MQSKPSLRLVCILTALALAAPVVGCRMSRTSSRSFASLASIWSLSTSFRSSFGRPANRAAMNEDYAFDVAAVGAAAAASGEADALLRDDVTRVAETHGVTDWESLDETWLGLGIGLRHAGMSEGGALALVTRVFGPEMAERTRAAYRD